MKIEQINIENLRPHPKNPRLIMRDDVIDGICAGLSDGFKDKYAIHVRPIGDHFEIISGHHRVNAAVKSNISIIPCWVEVMDDETAQHEMLMSNITQAELSLFEKQQWLDGFVEKERIIYDRKLKEGKEVIGIKDKKTNPCVYLLYCKEFDLYKIGYTANRPEHRAAQIQNSSFFEVEVIHSVIRDDALKREGELHRLYVANNHRREWFRFSLYEVEAVIQDMGRGK